MYQIYVHSVRFVLLNDELYFIVYVCEWWAWGDCPLIETVIAYLRRRIVFVESLHLICFYNVLRINLLIHVTDFYHDSLL